MWVGSYRKERKSTSLRRSFGLKYILYSFTGEVRFNEKSVEVVSISSFSQRSSEIFTSTKLSHLGRASGYSLRSNVGVVCWYFESPVYFCYLHNYCLMELLKHMKNSYRNFLNNFVHYSLWLNAFILTLDHMVFHWLFYEIRLKTKTSIYFKWNL